MPEIERRLAAILAADVVGYSRLAEADEAAALQRLRRLRLEVIEPALARHRGRLVKLMGDGVLAEFASVVDAAACAVALQEGTEVLAEGRADALQLRIGINLGDVVVEGGDLMGDGVNIAARLEALAEPGRIVVSGTAYDHLHGKLGLSFASLGEVQLKNIARPVRAYRIGRDGGTHAPAPAIHASERPSLAVLPFANLSGDPAQAYFSDGITEDLITELSRFRDLVVLARHSSFALRGQPHDAVELGRRLGVRYLLEGSLRKAGQRVRVTAQLIDASAGGAHLWAERYDRALDDIFAVQDEVVATIATTLVGRIEAAGLERARRLPTADLAAYDLVLQGMDRLAAYGPEANAAARGLLERAIFLDPEYAIAHAYLALAIFNQDWGTETGASLELSLVHARRAVALDASDSRCHRILALALLFARDFDRADHHSQRSLALNPNDAHATVFRAFLLACFGRAEEALPLVRRALERNPFHPAFFWSTLARTLHATGRYEEALAAYARVPEPGPHHYVRLAACHARLGDVAAARACVERVLAGKPDFSSAAWVATVPLRAPGDRQRLMDDLLAAGLPP